jgi:hypothetical protein
MGIDPHDDYRLLRRNGFEFRAGGEAPLGEARFVKAPANRDFVGAPGGLANDLEDVGQAARAAQVRLPQGQAGQQQVDVGVPQPGQHGRVAEVDNRHPHSLEGDSFRAAARGHDAPPPHGHEVRVDPARCRYNRSGFEYLIGFHVVLSACR